MKPFFFTVKKWKNSSKEKKSFQAPLKILLYECLWVRSELLLYFPEKKYILEEGLFANK